MSRRGGGLVVLGELYGAIYGFDLRGIRRDAHKHARCERNGKSSGAEGKEED
jgi:hypothetical protein